MYYETTKELLAFIKKSPTAFHAVEEMQARLTEDGFQVLSEKEHWKLTPGGKYVVTRNHSALIAFTIPEKESWKFHIIASHSDSPSFKIKENPEIVVEKTYVKLNVEKYGGMLMAPWFDRPLSIAGRVIVRKDGKLEEKLIDFDRNLVMLPNLAIHMNREANEGYKYNVQKDMLPLYGCGGSGGMFMEDIARAAGVAQEDMIGSDLFLYNRMEGSIWGAQEEFISIGRLDDLQCAFASLQAFLEADGGESIPVHCVYDNEEVGSGTKQGAGSTFLLDTLLRINEGLGRSPGQYRQALASSFMLSADNAHGVHPNYPEKACPTNRPYLNEGIVIKYSANQKYTTDGMAAAVFTQICERAGVPVQKFLNRSDILGGSTLGNISGTQVALNSVDIGLAQLAMHSPYETGGIKDTDYLIAAAKEFFRTSVVEIGSGEYRVKE